MKIIDRHPLAWFVGILLASFLLFDTFGFAQEAAEAPDRTAVSEEAVSDGAEASEDEGNLSAEPVESEEAFGTGGTELPEITVQAPYEAPPAPTRPQPTAVPQISEPAVAESEADLQTSASDGAESAWGPVDGMVATRSATGIKTDTPIVEIPQSISVITAEQIEEQGSQTIAQALRYTPGVEAELWGGGFVYDEARIRGFEPLNYLDGLAVPLNQRWATPRIEPYGMERIEVLKGPSSVLYGQNSPGGIINMVSKRPTAEPFGEVVLQTGSYERLQGAFDIGGPVDKQGKFRYRMTALGRDADTVVDFSEDNEVYLAPSFEWRPSDDTSITLLTSYGKDEASFPYQFVPGQGTLLPNPNGGRLPRSRYFGDPEYDGFEREQWWVGYVAEHRVNESIQLRQNLRYTEVDMNLKALRAEGLQPDLRTLNRTAFQLESDAQNFAIDNQAQFDFNTSVLEHTVLLGVDYSNTSGSQYVGAQPSAMTIDIYAPKYGGVPDFTFFSLYDNDLNLEQAGAYAQDQITLNNWRLTLGMRHDWAKTRFDSRVTNSVTKLDDEAFSWRAGLSYLFDNGLAPYASYSTSFQPQVGVDVYGDPFDPTTGEQYEAGIKYQPPGMDALFTFAAFDITQENVITNEPATFIAYQSGEARVKGIELEARMSLTDNIDVIAGYAHLNSEYTESVNPLQIGRPLNYAADNQASAWLDYTFHKGLFAGLKIGGGVRYTGSYYVDAITINPQELPSRTLYDAAATYDLVELSRHFDGMQLQLNVTNIADEYFLTYCYTEAYCTFGEGRTVLTSLRYRW
ncbi:TonB-dependent siderophore receptor [Methyloligella solikamskensis]|uniref:TonB-dependent siderophore receptor n=1 Tax=Methyloligella solikamskensis TaxID=1177756 RepID=A0ABW3JB62_9HYPH